ncbi:MAG: DUF1491 family protein [Emcibacteraceae bacterium]|nr:DUF1491 family protein [Emcibacteraceae bacterium]
MSFDTRLKTGLWVAAEIRRLEIQFIPAVVLHKGDEARGLVLIKQYVHGQGARLYSQTRDIDDNLIWHEPLGGNFMEERKADEYITRQRNFDEDLWVIEIEDNKGQYKPEN